MRAGPAAPAAALLVAGAALLVGCSAPAPAPCDDRARPAPVPAATAARQAAQGIGPVAGAGDVWLVVPATGRWGDLVEAGDGGHVAKLAVWADRDGPLPSIEVRRRDATGTGSAELRPTTAGLPGPVPAHVVLPAPGCWEVVVRGREGTATAVLPVP